MCKHFETKMLWEGGGHKFSSAPSSWTNTVDVGSLKWKTSNPESFKIFLNLCKDTQTVLWCYFSCKELLHSSDLSKIAALQEAILLHFLSMFLDQQNQYPIETCSKCKLPGSIAIRWTQKLRGGGGAQMGASNLCFSQASEWFWWRLKSENYYHHQKKKCKETGECSKNNEVKWKA